MNVLRSKRSVAGLAAALVTMAGLTLFVVLPALASNSGDRIPPAASPSGLVPVDVPLGGNGTCSNLFTSAVSALPSLHEYDNVNPGTATGLPSGRGDGVTFRPDAGRLEPEAGAAAQFDERRDRGHRDQGRVGVGGVRLHGAPVRARRHAEMGHGRRDPARTCVEVHGQRRGREPLPVVRDQPARPCATACSRRSPARCSSTRTAPAR